MSDFTMRLFRETGCPLRTERLQAETPLAALQMARRRLEATSAFSRVEVVADDAVVGGFEADPRSTLRGHEVRPVY